MRNFAISFVAVLASFQLAKACMTDRVPFPEVMLENETLAVVRIVATEDTIDRVQPWAILGSSDTVRAKILTLVTTETFRGPHRDRWKVVFRSERYEQSDWEDQLIMAAINPPGVFGWKQQDRSYVVVRDSDNELVHELYFQPCRGSGFFPIADLSGYPNSLDERFDEICIGKTSFPFCEAGYVRKARELFDQVLEAHR